MFKISPASALALRSDHSYAIFQKSIVFFQNEIKLFGLNVDSGLMRHDACSQTLVECNAEAVELLVLMFKKHLLHAPDVAEILT